MNLSTYIKHLQDIFTEHGEIESLYTSSDDEGNSYNEVFCTPGIAYIHDDDKDQGCVETLIPGPNEGETVEDMIRKYTCYDEDDEIELSKYTKVVAL